MAWTQEQEDQFDAATKQLEMLKSERNREQIIERNAVNEFLRSCDITHVTADDQQRHIGNFIISNRVKLVAFLETLGTPYERKVK